jgi:dolichol-phosphate mannosyltransferase
MDIFVKMDADDQMDPRNLLELIEPLTAGCADYTKGNRFHDAEAPDADCAPGGQCRTVLP